MSVALGVNSVKIPFLGERLGISEGAQIFQLMTFGNQGMTFVAGTGQVFAFQSDAIMFRKPSIIRTIFFDAQNMTADSFFAIKGGQTLRLPAGKQGYIPITFPFPIHIDISSTLGAGTLLISLYNFNVDPLVWGNTSFTDYLANYNSVSFGGFREEFLNHVGTASTSLVGGNVIVFDTGWLLQGIGSEGSISSGAPAASYVNPGVSEMFTNAAATTGQGIVLFKNNGTTVAVLGQLGLNAPWQYDFVIGFPNALGLTTLSLRAGFALGAGMASDPPSDGIWVEYDTANANSNASLTFRTNKASAANYVASTHAPVIDIFYHLRIRSLVKGTILFSVVSINNVLTNDAETAVSTDITTQTLSPFFQILTRATAQKGISLDLAAFSAANGRV